MERLSSFEAERVCLGCVLLDNDQIDKALAAGVGCETFTDNRHRVIWFHITAMHEDGRLVDPITLGDEIKKHRRLAQAGGLEYLDNLTDGIPRVTHLENYLTILDEKRRLRKLRQVGQKVIRMTDETGDSSTQIWDWLTDEIQDRPGSEGGLMMLAESIPQTLETIQRKLEAGAENKTGMQTGFLMLDRVITEVERGDLFVIGARPSVGKTAFALSVSDYMARTAGPVAWFCFETSREKMDRRWIAQRTGAELYKLKAGRGFDAETRASVMAVANEVPGFPLYWSGTRDTPPTVTGIRRALRSIPPEHKPAAIFVDHLHLMRAGDQGYSTGNRAIEVANITRALKELAEESGLVVFLLSQLNRSMENRSGDDRRPQLSDLRDSGSIEQDADFVCFIHRPEIYAARKEGRPQQAFQTAELFLAKNKEGPCGVVRIGWQGAQAQYINELPGGLR